MKEVNRFIYTGFYVYVYIKHKIFFIVDVQVHKYMSVSLKH